jgi:hypothetical protein
MHQPFSRRHDVFDSSGCAKRFPTFSQFLAFVAARPAQHNEHWWTYGRNCAPCVLDYDAVVKLETHDVDARHVMKAAGLDAYAKLEVRQTLC